MASRWFTGRADVFLLDELLGTKLRTFYQRKKGRDLFDPAKALETVSVEHDRVVACFSRYMQQGTRAMFGQNLSENAASRYSRVFTGDIRPLFAAGTTWDLEQAFESVLRKEFVARLPGAWRGGKAGGHDHSG